MRTIFGNYGLFSKEVIHNSTNPYMKKLFEIEDDSINTHPGMWPKKLEYTKSYQQEPPTPVEETQVKLDKFYNLMISSHYGWPKEKEKINMAVHFDELTVTHDIFNESKFEFKGWSNEPPTPERIMRALYPKKEVNTAFPKIKDVRFNGPATIVFWSDDTKTVVKAQDEEFDPEKGLAMAIAKKALGNKHDYYNVIAKYTKRYYKEKTND